jgi:hypothetical protein
MNGLSWLAVLVTTSVPPAAESAPRGRPELLLEFVEAAEHPLQGVRQLARRLAATLGAHHLPEERVVGVPTAVIPDRGANRLRHAVDTAEEFFQRLLL